MRRASRFECATGTRTRQTAIKTDIRPRSALAVTTVSWLRYNPNVAPLRISVGEGQTMSTAVAPKGLEGIVATTSSICWIDGDAGVLSYRGIDIHELAAKSTFEETTYLLWYGKLPTAAELAGLQRRSWPRRAS